MTFSICVREQYEDDEGEEQYRFGVAVTTRLAGVGTLCPFASEHGAIATQSRTNVDLGRSGIEYLADGLAVEDALEAMLNADDGKPGRQVHGVDRDGEFAFSGEECKDWFGHTAGENYTVAGNLLAGESVVEATAAAYETSRSEDRPLAFRLADALEAGHGEGGDKREELHVQSAAAVVRTTEPTDRNRPYNDIRVDATETPIVDLQGTLATAREGHETVLEHYGESDEADEATE